MSSSDIPHIFGTGPLSEGGIKPTVCSSERLHFVITFPEQYKLLAQSDTSIDYYHGKEKNGLHVPDPLPTCGRTNQMPIITFCVVSTISIPQLRKPSKS